MRPSRIRDKFMKQKLNRFLRLNLPLTFLLVFIVSCDPGVDYSKIVQNNSDYNVKVLKGFGIWYLDGKDTVYKPIDTITIAKGSSAVIFTELHIGTLAGSGFQACSAFNDSVPMFVYFTDSIKVIPNIHKLNYWNYRIIKEYKVGGGGVCECRINLTNEILAE